ncbi:hypothetical protein GCK72_006160 [Caenorhabditis remanei]|uniref:Uncharacterized protein n=1 Tax=Caenorhabditis remanei TaxID=31234 RepID=A0A6A5HHT7_CAERE|nr:hypothetical protein GCK72_006160 [Caenorhabditis remanei]KAF1766204.1 hypothetical protein GCK72_006160 [Caenorhabditis remanei]
MKLLFGLALFCLVQFAATSLMRNWMHDFESRFPVEEDTEEVFDINKMHPNMMARSRRGEKIKMCGGKVWKMVMATCGGECTTVDVNIATACCETMCTMEEIGDLCCPGR